MALALAPFGLRPLKGCRYRTKAVQLAVTHAALFIGDVLLGGDVGATRCATDTAGSQTAIIGVVAEIKAANAGGIVMCYEPLDSEFEIQTSIDGASWTSQEWAAGGFQLGDCDLSPAGSSTTGRSFVRLEGTEASTNCLIIQRLAPIPGNDLVSGSFPIWVVRFNEADVMTGGVTA